MSKSYRYRGLGLTTKERNAGGRKFTEYQTVYPHLNKLSDLQLLEHLVFLETLEERYKTRIGELSRNTAATKIGITPSSLLKDLNDNSAEIINLKEKLGLFADKKLLDAFQRFQDIIKKFTAWGKDHVLERKTTCPFCSKPFILKIRTDKYEPIKTPFFKDKILANPELWDAYQKGEITKLRYSKILGTSEDFIDWLKEKVFDIKVQKK